eukprot:15442749-Alexandrium_andersonii.AAC.1
MEGGKRPRYSGPVCHVVGRLEPFVTGRCWLAYKAECDGDKNSTRQPPLQTGELLRQWGVIKSLRELQNNMCFTQDTMVQAYREVEANKSGTLELKDDQKEDWINTMARRTRLLLRHAQRGLERSNQTSWARELRAKMGLEAARGKKLQNHTNMHY